VIYVVVRSSWIAMLPPPVHGLSGGYEKVAGRIIRTIPPKKASKPVHGIFV